MPSDCQVYSPSTTKCSVQISSSEGLTDEHTIPSKTVIPSVQTHLPATFHVSEWKQHRSGTYFNGPLPNKLLQFRPSCSSCSHDPWRCKRQSVPKRRHIKFRRRGITQKKEYNMVLQFYEGVQECMWRFARHDTVSLTGFTRSLSQKYKTCTRRADWNLWLVFLRCNRNSILGRLVATMTRVVYLLETEHTDLNNLAAQMRGCACIWEAIQSVLFELPRTTFHFYADKFNEQSLYGHSLDSD